MNRDAERAPVVLQWRPSLLAVLLACALSACAQPPLRRADRAPVASSIAITGVTVVDVTTGVLVRDQTVLVRGRHIAAIVAREGAAIPHDAEQIDGRGKFLIPGLWDMHSHIVDRWAWYAPLYLAYGVTGARDMGAATPLAHVRELAREVDDGRALGPRIVAAGPLVDGPNPSFPPPLGLPVGTAERGRFVVDSLARAGAWFIKLYNLLPRDAVFAIAAEARRIGIPVAGHLPHSVTAEEASDSGMQSIEHGLHARECARLDTPPSARPAELIAAYDPERCRTLGRRFARNGTWITPTIVQSLPSLVPAETLLADDRIRTMDPRTAEAWRARIADDQIGRQFARDEIQWRLRAVRDLHAGGAFILAGTDAGPYWAVRPVGDEVEMLTRAGLSSLEALQSATLNPARFLHASDSLGTVSPGKIADLVVLDADPLADLRNLRRIHAVLVDGRLLRRATLDSLLGAAHRNAPADTSARRRPPSY